MVPVCFILQVICRLFRININKLAAEKWKDGDKFSCVGDVPELFSGFVR